MLIQKNPNFSTIYSNGGLGTSCPIDEGIHFNIANKNRFSIYPNPGNDIINLSTGDIIPESIEIKNILGQTILCLNNIDRELTKINIADFAQGVYFLKANFGYKNSTGLFIKN